MEVNVASFAHASPALRGNRHLVEARAREGGGGVGGLRGLEGLEGLEGFRGFRGFRGV